MNDSLSRAHFSLSSHCLLLCKTEQWHLHLSEVFANTGKRFCGSQKGVLYLHANSCKKLILTWFQKHDAYKYITASLRNLALEMQPSVFYTGWGEEGRI